MDDELLAIAMSSIGRDYGLTVEQSRRLRGSNAKSLREDASRMRGELGLPPLDERERDENGRFRTSGEPLDMNRVIREAAGR